jgi:hypothetical protein
MAFGKAPKPPDEFPEEHDVNRSPISRVPRVATLPVAEAFAAIILIIDFDL